MKEKESEHAPSAALSKLDFGIVTLCVFIVAVPWLYDGTTDQHRARVILASIPFLLVSIANLQGPKVPRIFDRLVAWGFALVFIGLLFSAAFAERSVIAWLRVLELVWAGSMVFCVSCKVASRPRSVFYIVSAIAFAYCISNARLYLDWMLTPGDPRGKDWVFAIPGYFHLRNLGFAAAPALLVLGWLPFSDYIQNLADRNKRLVVVLLWLAAVAGWGVLGWSGSRAGVLSAFVGLVAWMLLTRGRVSWIKASAFSLSACVVGACLSIRYTPFDSNFGVLRILGRTTQGGGTADEYSSGRLTVWLDGLSRWVDSWILGIGPDQYASQAGLPNRLLEPHNAIVDVALEAGVLGIVGLLLVVVSVFFKFSFSRKDSISPIVYSLILLYGVFSMVDGTLVWTLPLAYISILLGSLFGLNANKVTEKSLGVLFELLVSRSLIPVVVACTIVFYFVHYQSNQLMTALPGSDSFTVRSLYRFPVTTWGVNAWLGEWEKHEEGDLDAWYNMLIEESPAPYFYRIEYAYFLIRYSRLAEARDQFTEALRIAPVGVLRRLNKQHGPVLEKLDGILGPASN